MRVHIRFNILSVIVFLVLFSHTFPQFKTPTFEYFSNKNGLPENNVTSIFQNHLSSLWLRTQSELMGESITPYLQTTRLNRFNIYIIAELV